MSTVTIENRVLWPEAMKILDPIYCEIERGEGDVGKHGKFLYDVAVKSRTYVLTEKQAEAVVKTATRSDSDDDDVTYLPVPRGKLYMRGRVLSAKWYETTYNGKPRRTMKMLVVGELLGGPVKYRDGTTSYKLGSPGVGEAWKVFGTVPKSIRDGGISVGDTVRFRAQFAPSREDERFGIYKYPSDGITLTRSGADPVKDTDVARDEESIDYRGLIMEKKPSGHLGDVDDDLDTLLDLEPKAPEGVATCDLCGRTDDHEHDAEEWGIDKPAEPEPLCSLNACENEAAYRRSRCPNCSKRDRCEDHLAHLGDEQCPACMTPLRFCPDHNGPVPDALVDALGYGAWHYGAGEPVLCIVEGCLMPIDGKEVPKEFAF